MHTAISLQYPAFEELSQDTEPFKKVFNSKGYKPSELLEVPEYRSLVDELSNTFNSTIPTEVSDVMREYLKRDSLIFSGLKAHRELTEARSYLTDNKGNLRPYHQFERDIEKLNKAYNKHYLRTEYEFAAHSAQSAERWDNLQSDTTKYWLEYRTANDERVRTSHSALQFTVLPKDDPFWDSYYPPNGWNCRCIAIEVLARKATKSNSKEAITKGDTATTEINGKGKNTAEMFRFNPGKQRKLFPPKNSYAPKNCKGEKLNLSGLIGYSTTVLSLEKENCQALNILEKEAA